MSNENTTTDSAAKSVTLEIIRETGDHANWLNRYCQNPETGVHPLIFEAYNTTGNPLLLHSLLEF
jgi:hypothetical protein